MTLTAHLAPDTQRPPLWTAVRRFLVAVALLGAATIAAHWVWLGWDVEYQPDPETGRTSGPYEAWQVAGCVFTLLGVAVAAGVRRHGLAAFLVMPVVFTTAWSIDAAAADDSGLWPVGAALIFVAMSLGVPLVAALSKQVSRTLRGRRANPSP